MKARGWRSKSVKTWQRGLLVAWAAQFLCLLGFDACFPFIPFYIRELGVTKPQHVAMWAGIIMSGVAVTVAVVSPLWGILADRRGPKLMVLRAAFGGAITLVAMALVANVQQFFVLRVVQAALTGFVLTFVMLIAALAPPSRIGFSLGVMQMGAYLAFSVGPVIGGMFADRFGYRWLFGSTAILLAVGGVLVLVLLPGSPTQPRAAAQQGGVRSGFRAIVRSRSLISVLVIIAVIYMANTVSRPALPLYVETLTSDSGKLNMSTGVVYGVMSFASAVSAVAVGRLGDRIGYRRILLLCAAGLALAYFGQAMSSTLAAFLTVTFGTGMFVGGLLPTANAVIARTAPKKQQGTVYGLGTTLSSGGRVVGPMLGAAVAATWGVRYTFAVAGLLFALVTGWIALASRSIGDDGTA
jgi:DHA1 family multidrug resistance protein-like MFS transporter